MPPEDRDLPPAELHRLQPADIDPDLMARAPGRAGRRPRPVVIAVVAAGGVPGTACRYGLSRAIHVAPGSFPWATFTINLTGSFVLGVLLTFVIERWPPSRYLRPFAAIGFLGAYTTFSTYMTEAVLLVKDHASDVAAIYVVASLLLGLAAVYLGIVVSRLWPMAKEGA
jgi:CrcB protein